MIQILQIRRRLALRASLAAVAAGILPSPLIPSVTAAPVNRVPIQLPAQPLEQSLKDVARLTGVNILFSPDLVAGRNGRSLRGSFTAEEAVARLIAGQRLRVAGDGHGGVVVRAGEPVGAVRPAVPLRAPRPANAIASREAAASSSNEASEAGGAAEQHADELSDSSSSPADIVVTAQRRAQRLQDVPISMAVISAEEIHRRGYTAMEDYLRSLPSVSQIERGVDNSIVIRGITTSPQSENFNSGTTVSTYFGETPITSAAGLAGGGVDIKPVDLERIEVLRGPQGTSYGSSSLGGTLRLLPARPDLSQWHGRVEASLSKTARYGSDNSVIQGMINVPVVKDHLAIRAVGYRFDDSGFYRNIVGTDAAALAIAASQGLTNYVKGFSQHDVGRTTTIGGRVTALWQPVDNFDVAFHFLKQKTEQDGAPEADRAGYSQVRIPITPQDRGRGQAGEVADTEIRLASIDARYRSGLGEISAALSRVKGNAIFARDVSTQLSPRFPASDLARGDFRSTTFESRYVSTFAGPVHLIAGFYYEDISQAYLETIDWPLAPAPSPLALGTNPISLSDRDRGLKQRAVYGELTYDITPKLSATIGGRYFNYDRDERVLREGSLFGVAIGTGVNQYLRNSNDGKTLKAVVNYKPSRNSLLYASFAQGFRLGRTDVGLPVAQCDKNGDGIVDGTTTTIASTQNINSDFLDSYEVGGKFSLLERRLTLDASVYRINWDGLPIRAITPGTCGRAYTANVGGARSTGAEFQASLAVTRAFRLDFGASYVDAELSQDAPGIAGSPKAGARLPGSPKWSANLSGQYEFAIGANEGFARIDGFYVGPFYGDLLQSPLTKAGDYVKIDTRVGIKFDYLSVELFAKNITNENAYTWRGLTNANANFGYLMRPRTLGVQLGYSF